MFGVNGVILWVGVLTVLAVLITRWRIGAWDIDAEKGPPSPSIASLVALVAGLIMVGVGSYLIIMDN